MKRIICTLLCAVMMVCCLASCSAEFDAKTYVQGNIDVVYLNAPSEAYLNIVSNSKDDLSAIYEKGLEVEAGYFATYFSIDLELAPEDTLSRIVELYRQIYTYSKYEVGEPVKGDNEYMVDITIHPMDIIKKVAEEDWAAFEEEWKGLAEQRVDMTEAEIEAAWADMVIKLVEERIPNIGYFEPQTITIKVTKGEDGIYVISDNDFGRIDCLIIQY